MVSSKKCTRCGKKLPLLSVNFSKNKRSKDGYRSSCKRCDRKARLRSRRDDSSDPRERYENHIKSKYGLTIKERDYILDSQNGCCAICKCELSYLLITNLKKKKPNIDHNHETGNVRGILCPECNRALGLFKDDLSFLKSAVIYLEAQ